MNKLDTMKHLDRLRRYVFSYGKCRVLIRIKWVIVTCQLKSVLLGQFRNITDDVKLGLSVDDDGVQAIGVVHQFRVSEHQLGLADPLHAGDHGDLVVLERGVDLVDLLVPAYEGPHRGPPVVGDEVRLVDPVVRSGFVPVSGLARTCSDKCTVIVGYRS